MDKKKKRLLLLDCIWKPVFAAVMTVVFTFNFDSGKIESLVIALILGGLCGLNLYLEVRNYIAQEKD